MNWKRLLIKYVEHVGACEGIDFLGDDWKWSGKLSDKDLAWIRDITNYKKPESTDIPLTRSPAYEEKMKEILTEHLYPDGPYSQLEGRTDVLIGNRSLPT